MTDPNGELIEQLKEALEDHAPDEVIEFAKDTFKLQPLIAELSYSQTLDEIQELPESENNN